MPNNWKTYKLSELSELITKGTTPSTYGYKSTETGINYIKSDSTNYDGILDESVFVKIPIEAHEKLKRSQLKENDILFSIAGAYLGKSGVVRKSHLPANTNQANAIIRINQDFVLSDYISLALRSPKLIHYVNASTGQSAQPNLNLTDLGNLEFHIPPLPEQKAIANILSAVDDKIENNLAINKTLEDMAMALYKHWFVDFGPFQDGEFIDSELGPIPKGWEVKRLEDLALFKNGKGINRVDRIDNGNYKIFGSNGLIGFTNKVMFNEPVVAIGRVGANYGEIHYSVEPCWISDNAITVQPKIQDCFWWLLQTLRIIDYSNFAGGSAQPLITQGAVKDYEVTVPKDDEILKFSLSIQKLFINLNNNFKENETLTNLRDTLLPKLISGEVRLKEFQNQIETVL